MSISDILQMFRGQPAQQAPQSPIDPITQKYPRLAGPDWKVGYGQSQDDRQLEFYPPDEERNPQKGSPYIEIYNKGLQGDDLQRAIFGDMLHYLPRIDPEYEGMRQKFAQTFTPEQKALNQRRYQETQTAGDENRPFQQWMDQSQLDAYLRGYLAPDQANEWQNVYTPNQRQLLEGIKQLLMKPR